MSKANERRWPRREARKGPETRRQLVREPPGWRNTEPGLGAAAGVPLGQGARGGREGGGGGFLPRPSADSLGRERPCIQTSGVFGRRREVKILREINVYIYCKSICMNVFIFYWAIGLDICQNSTEKYKHFHKRYLLKSSRMKIGHDSNCSRGRD